MTGDERYRPDDRYADPAVLGALLEERVLPLVARPTRYLGGETGADRRAWDPARANVLLAFPDAYEIGMSHTGLRILYALLNRDDIAFADLAFAPWPDLEALLRAERMPLFGLQSRRSAAQFDVLAFSLGYELSYTNVLTMIDLAGLPLRAGARHDGDPLVVAGGACATNPTVLAPFVDLFLTGDGEESVLDLAAAVRAARTAGEGRAGLLARLGRLPGAWRPDAPGSVRPRVLADLNRFAPPAGPVPVTEAVHDRLSVEVMRGCARGCRFCQAGMLHRPVRERDPARVAAAAAAGVAATGWNEVSLLSLSTSDYGGLAAAVVGIQRTADPRTNLVLPSLRVDSLDPELYGEISREEPGSFTFAPEAGSQRLRDVINKNVSEAEVLTSVERAFAAGAKGLKLYFMIGLPTETDEDLRALVELVRRIVRCSPRGGGAITVSISPFSPKPHTPFQWAGQIPREEITRRNHLLERELARLRVKVSLRDAEVSELEALLGLGDGRCAEAVLAAWRAGARFDGWGEWFNAARWTAAFAAAGVDTAALLAPRDPEAPLPWDDLDIVDGAFLRAEWARARRGEITADCRLEGICGGCGACCGEIGQVAAAPVAPTPPAPPATARSGAAQLPAFDPRNASPEDPAHERRRWTVWRGQAPGRCWHRAEYTKLGPARFLGHLDFQRLLQLALRRAGVPVAYSLGFHPHPLLKFGPPLPVGVEGEREVCDVALERPAPDWVAVLNAVLPDGVRLRGAEPVGPILPESVETCVGRFDYAAALAPRSTGGPDPAVVRECVARFLAAAVWPHVRRREKGDVELDVRPCVPVDGLLSATHGASPDDATVLTFSILRQTGAPGLPPHDFLTALLGDLLPEPRLCRVRRTALLGRDAAGHWRTPLVMAGEANRRLWLRKRVSA